MKHCEEERDARDDKFNPDSYISMKLLLLDIKSWLMGSIIGDATEYNEDKHKASSGEREPEYDYE